MRAIPGNRIVATLGPYKYSVAIPLAHLYKFKARMRLQSCGLLCVCRGYRAVDGKGTWSTIPGSCTIATLGLYTWQGANYTFIFKVAWTECFRAANPSLRPPWIYLAWKPQLWSLMRAIPGNRIVATLGPYKYSVAIPLTHLYKFKARMRLQSCGLLCVCRGYRAVDGKGTWSTIITW